MIAPVGASDKLPCGNVAAYAAVNPWRCEQYKEREENLTEFTLA